MNPGVTLDQIMVQRGEKRAEIVAVDEPTVKLVIFELSGTPFAFYGENVREILARARVFFVPGSPASMEGVVNVRGDIETVIRPQSLLRLPESDPGPSSTILLAKGDGVTSGIRVDRVLDVLDIPRSAILPIPSTLPAHWNTLALGVATLGGQAVTLLDVNTLLGDYARGLG
ncbi:MAG: chemotaxis protein CheW [Magnetococcales bacterium]|nr:chemotaxis protein CheW [Magnetococcales bacterium]